jgi:hypothetical protein
VLPNTFILGAAKCGTTSLWAYLEQHPEIKFSRRKEPAIFIHADYRERLEWYESLFRPAPIRGEASVWYTMDPVFRHVPERIHSLIPEPNLIYMVRDPVERAISHYVETVAQREENRPVATALLDPDPNRNQYLAASRYATQLRRYLDCFDAPKLLVLEQSDLRDHAAQTLKQVFGFLGVDPEFAPSSVDVEVRRSDQRRKLRGIGASIRDSRPGDAAVHWLFRRLPPATAARITGAIKRPLSAPVTRPEIPEPIRTQLQEELAPEANWLRAYTGQSFDTWSC